MQQYGANAWRVYNYRLEVVGKNLDKAIEELNERVTEVNRTRKNDQVSANIRTLRKPPLPSFPQMAVGKQLTALEKKWTELISSVLQIEIANSALEAEVAMLSQRESELEQMLVQ